MDHIGANLAKIEQNIKVNSADPIALHGFTQLPNFILRNPDISIGAKTTYSLSSATPGTTASAFQGKTHWPKRWA